MHKKGQLGDILEFKVALLILIVIFLVAIVIFNLNSISSYGEEKVFSFDSRIKNLQQKIFYHDLLMDRLKQNNLDDQIVKGEDLNIENMRIVHPKDFDDIEEFKLNYNVYFDDYDFNQRREIYIYFSDGLTHTIIPTFDGDYIIGVVMKNEQES